MGECENRNMRLRYYYSKDRIKNKKLRKEFKADIMQAAKDGQGGLIWGKNGKGHVAHIQYKFKKSLNEDLLNEIHIDKRDDPRIIYTYVIYISGWEIV